MVKQYQVVISSRAQASLDEIVTYLIENKSLELALKTERRLLEKIQTLKELPDRGAALRIKRKKHSKIPYRCLLENPYKIIYTAEEDPDSQVIIIELFHMSRSTKSLEDSLP